MVSGSKNKALNSIIQHYIGEPVSSVEEGDRCFLFRTGFGKSGSVRRSINGNDWVISIEGEIIDSIEYEVFSTLVETDGNYTLGQYSSVLQNLIESEKIKYRSKSLVSKILVILEDYMINSEDFIPSDPVIIGTNCIFSHRGIRFMYCLN